MKSPPMIRLAILANAVIYGTDVFGAIVLRPAIVAVDDRTLTQLPGHSHRIADRRFPAIGASGLIAAVATAALAGASGHWVSAAAAALATLSLVIFLAIYNRVSKPVNTALTAAALADRSPPMRRARRRLTDSRRLSGWEPAALITTRNRPICQQEGTNEQPGSENVAPGR